MSVLINGVLIMFFGTGTVFGSHTIAMRSDILERVGSYLFIAGVAVWGIAITA
jgi:hypothetical protein